MKTKMWGKLDKKLPRNKSYNNVNPYDMYLSDSLKTVGRKRKRDSDFWDLLQKWTAPPKASRSAENFPGCWLVDAADKDGGSFRDFSQDFHISFQSSFAALLDTISSSKFTQENS